MNKKIVILEGADQCGKTQLSMYLQNIYFNGKCHVLHSNYSKYLPQTNHYNQHKLMTKFAIKLFKDKYYTGNNGIIFDRNYISDIIYGSIGYGSKGNIKNKFKKLNKFLSKLDKNCEDTSIYIIYCNPSIENFNTDTKEELLNNKQNDKIRKEYDNFFHNNNFLNILIKNHVTLLTYDFTTDPKYKELTKYLNLDWRFDND